MRIYHLQVKNFRCFTDFSLDFNEPLIVITGRNGSGKSSLLEALHYCCYLRSFRTHLPRELINFISENFFIKIKLHSQADALFDHELQVGFSKKKRLIKIDQHPVQSYKELAAYYRVITATEDDLVLIKGSPDIRRLFLDQALMLENPSLAGTLKRYRHIVENRNALLQQPPYNYESYKIWTEQLWTESITIQEQRRHFLANLEEKIQQLLHELFDKEMQVSFTYHAKKTEIGQSFEDFWMNIEAMRSMEGAFKRSLFGAHLDDFSINFCNKTSRAYASRGQQKLLIMIIKIAQMEAVALQSGPLLLLLDDFLTDFDEHRGRTLLSYITQLPHQIIITRPTRGGYLEELVQSGRAQHIELTP